MRSLVFGWRSWDTANCPKETKISRKQNVRIILGSFGLNVAAGEMAVTGGKAAEK